MQKRTYLTLTLCVSCLLLLVACGAATNDNAANANATKATTSSNTAVVTTNTPAATTPAAGDKIGVPECDDYLAKYETCITGKVPEAARAQYKATMESTRKSWRDLAANPQTKASLAQACKLATESAKTSMKALGCEF